MSRQQFVLFIWIAWGAFSLGMLVFVLACPKLWASLVDKENEYWVKRGRLSSGSAEKIKKLEKGFAMKLALGVCALLCFVNIYLLLHPPAHPPFRAVPPPPGPAPHRQPAH